MPALSGELRMCDPARFLNGNDRRLPVVVAYSEQFVARLGVAAQLFNIVNDCLMESNTLYHVLLGAVNNSAAVLASSRIDLLQCKTMVRDE